MSEDYEQSQFKQQQKDYVEELSLALKDQHVTEEFWQQLVDSVQVVVKQSALNDQDDDIDDSELELVLAEVSAKTQAFVKLIEKVKSRIGGDSEMDSESDEVLESEDVEMTEELQSDEEDSLDQDQEMT